MNRLYILRHADAQPVVLPKFSDFDRPLTPKGEKQLEQLIKWLKRLEVEIDRIVTSPLVRARRTAEVVAEGLDLLHRVELSEALRPGASADSIHEWLTSRTEDNLLIVGHNPDFSELIGLLLGMPGPEYPFNLKKGGIASLRLRQRQCYDLKWLATPKLIRSLIA